MLKLGRKSDDNKFTPEELAVISLDEVKKIIETQVPGAFTKKTAKKRAVKKTAQKTAKKTAKKKKE